MKSKVTLLLLLCASLVFGDTATVSVNTTTKVTAPPVGTLTLDGAGSFVITRGSGNPNGIVTAATGSMYLDQTGAIWVKQTGTGNIGWSALAGGGLTLPSTTNLFSGNGTGGITDSTIPPADVARLSFPNVFNQQVTFSGIQLGDITLVTSNYRALPTDTVILANCTAGPLTITLPPSVGNGQLLRIRVIDTSGNPATVQPASGDTIGVFSSLTIADPRLGILISDALPHQWDLMISPFLAHQNFPNVFTQVNNFSGIQIGNTQTVSGFYTPVATDFEILADASAGDVNILLPLSGTNQMYHIKQIGSVGHGTIIQTQGGELIDGAVSLTFFSPGSDTFLLASNTGYWDAPSSGPLPNTMQTNVSVWYRPEIGTNASLAAWPTLDNPINSRMDCVFPDGMRTYLIQPLAADPSDSGQVVPNDYNATTNNVHWQQQL